MPHIKPPIEPNEVIDLLKLRKQYGKGLKPYKQNEIEMFIRSFAHMAYKKYAKGAKEHRNNMTVEVAKRELLEVAKRELLEEAIDTFIYAMVVKSERPFDGIC